MNLIQILESCKSKNISITRQREVIINSVLTLCLNKKHPDVDDIYMAIKSLDSSLGIATIYRFLAILEESKIIIKHNFGDGKSRYEFNDKANHHDHLIDIETGDVIEFFDKELEVLKDQIAKKIGYNLTDNKLELIGTKIKS